MRKILSVMLIFFAIIFVGCGNDNSGKVTQTKIEEKIIAKKESVVEKKIYAGSEQRSCLCLKEKEYVDDFLKAAHDDDIEYLEKMAWTGKAFYITYDTRVLCSEGEVYKGMVYITVLEGKFEGYSGYTFPKRLRPIKKSPTSRNAGENF